MRKSRHKVGHNILHSLEGVWHVSWDSVGPHAFVAEKKMQKKESRLEQHLQPG